METDLRTSSTTGAAAVTLPPATGSSHINLMPSERIVSTFAGAALTVTGLQRLGSIGGIAMTLSGAFLLVRGLSGYCAITNAVSKGMARQSSAMEANAVFTINKPRSDVYAFWRKLENLPQFMQHLEEVKELDDARSKWTAKIPGGMGKVTWEAQIVEDISGEVISWSSLPGSTVDNAGEVRFSDAGERGTEVKACITYRLPGGDLGSIAARLFNPAIEKMMREDLRSFKTLIESSEVGRSTWEARSQSNPSGEQGNRPEYTVSGVH